MSTFVMLTRLSHEALDSPPSLEALGHEVTEHIHAECPGVDWVASYAILGPADYLDIFTAPDSETAMKVATVVRTYGHASTEVWDAISWDRFRDVLREMPARAASLEP